MEEILLYFFVLKMVISIIVGLFFVLKWFIKLYFLGILWIKEIEF